MSEEIEKKLEQFIKDTSDPSGSLRLPVLFCLNCGSIELDQNDVFSIECYNCHQTSLWNGLKFGITRSASVDEVAKMLMPAQEGYWEDWRSQLILSILNFGKVITELRYSADSNDSPKSQLEHKELMKLKEQWRVMKTLIDGQLD